MVAVGKQVLVIPDKAPEKIGNIIIPEKAKIRPSFGIVQSVGEGVEANLKPGDRIAYEQNCGSMVEELLSVEDEKILYIE